MNSLQSFRTEWRSEWQMPQKRISICTSCSVGSRRGIVVLVSGEVALVPLGDPPALPGRHEKFDSSGNPSRTLDDVSRQAHAEEVCDGRKQKPKPYEVGVQISCGVYSQVPP